MTQDNLPEPIAIIGTACRLPGGASSSSKLSELLKNLRGLLQDIPCEGFHWEGVYRSDGLYGFIKTHEGYFLDENIRELDPDLLMLSLAEAANVDPQHRLLLENVYEAVESADLCLDDLQGTDIGVFVGPKGGRALPNYDSRRRRIVRPDLNYLYCLQRGCESSFVCLRLQGSFTVHRYGMFI